MSGPSYLHAIEGRLRIKVPIIKRSARNAARVTCAVEELAGIHYVRANPTTGNMLVLFDPHVLAQEQIIAKLIELKCYTQRAGQYSSVRPRISGRLAETLLQLAVQVALERVILALV